MAVSMPLRNHQRFVKHQHEPGRPVLVLKGSEASVLTSAGKHLINVLNTFFHPRASKIRDVIGIQSLQYSANVSGMSRAAAVGVDMSSYGEPRSSPLYLSLTVDLGRVETRTRSTVELQTERERGRDTCSRRRALVKRQETKWQLFFFFPTQ